MFISHLSLALIRPTYPAIGFQQDFTNTAAALPANITFAASTARNRFNSAATLASTAIDVARANANQDYNPSTLAARGFLIEAEATNLLLQSQTFDNASWGKTDITVTANNAAAPDGTTTADLLTEGTAGTSSCNQAVTIVADSTLTQSFFVKRSGATPVQWVKTVVTSAGGITRAWFDVQNGVAGTVGGSAGTHTVVGSAIVSLPDGWYRISLTVTIATDTAATVVISSASADNNNSRLNDATYLLWGAQYEVLAFASSYYPTTTGAGTRGADDATIATLSSIGFSATQGTLYARFMVRGMGTANAPRVLSLNDGTGNNSIEIIIRDDTDDILRLLVLSGGAVQAAVQGPAISALTAYKVAASWSANSFRLAVNGTGYTEDTSGSIPAVDRLALGRLVTTNYLNGWLPETQYVPQQSSQSQLNAMTA